MLKLLKPIFTVRFIKFCTVGVSGVAVNLGCLALFAGVFGVQANLAAALAIEVSINTNFLVNEMWTFRDRSEGKSGFLKRLARFHLVSLVGAAIQWGIFVGMNLIFATTFGQDISLVAAVTDPPDVGNWMYLSQLTGIGVATIWNFVANFYWTWKHVDETPSRPALEEPDDR